MEPQRIEPNHALSFAQECFLTIREDGNLIAIEAQNGKLQRWITEEATRAKSLQIFGADRVQS